MWLFLCDNWQQFLFEAMCSQPLRQWSKLKSVLILRYVGPLMELWHYGRLHHFLWFGLTCGTLDVIGWCVVSGHSRCTQRSSIADGFAVQVLSCPASHPNIKAPVEPVRHNNKVLQVSVWGARRGHTRIVPLLLPVDIFIIKCVLNKSLAGLNKDLFTNGDWNWTESICHVTKLLSSLFLK